MATDAVSDVPPASDTSSEPDLQVVFEDLLVTNEGEWINAHRHNLLQLWNLLKQGKSRFDDNYLTGCNFRIFCSFVYRWTENEETDEDQTDEDDADMNSNNEDEGDECETVD